MRPFAAVALALLTLAAGLTCGEADPPPATVAPIILTLTDIATPPAAIPGRPAARPTPPSIAHPTLPPLMPAATPPAAGPRPRWVSPEPPPPSLSPVPPAAGKGELAGAAALDNQIPAAAQAIQARPWAAEGAAMPERAAALEALRQIALIDPAAARRIAAMPFLDTLGPADGAALESLAQLAAADGETLAWLLAQPALAGGLDDAAAKVAAVWAGVQQNNPALLPQLLDWERVTLEERVIELPRGEPITLVIIRLEPGDAGSMDLLAAAVRFVADYMGKPFPRRYVALLFADAVPDYSAGANFGTHIAVRPEFDAPTSSAAGGLAQSSGRAIAHEVAHYYWAGNAPWLDEGAAELLAALFTASRADGRPQAQHYPCAGAPGLGDLAGADYAPGTPGYRCNYALGVRLFLDLRRDWGAADFRDGFRSLYRALAAGNYAGAAALRRVFAGDSPEYQARLERVMARWRGGTAAAGGRLPEDPTAAVTDLPAPINGRIDRVYLSQTPGGPPSHRFSAAAVGDWAWLNLEYSYHFAGPPQELELAVVEYFEDGFAYRRVRDAVTLTAQSSGGWRRYSVGPGPGRPWAVGRHWVLVYHRGVKVAAVGYEVTG